MTDTATPETGPVDAPASDEGSTADRMAAQLVSEIEAGGGDDPEHGSIDAVVQEMVNEAEGQPGDSEQEPGTEDNATDPAEQAEEPTEGNPANDQLVTVKVNGEDREVPLSEALAGYSRLEDYKAKTAEVAREREQIEAQKARIEPELKAQFANQLTEATNLFAQYDPVLAEARTINWEALKQADPAAYVQAQDAVQARLTAIQQMQQRAETARGEATQQQQAQAEQERAQRFDQAAEKIVQAMPELADEAKFKGFASDAISTLKAEGFTSDEIASSLDHRVLTLADKARRWDAYQAAQRSLPEKKVVQKSAVKPLTTDAGSRATAPRSPPSNANRDRKVQWAVNQMLSEQE